jgi:hypothetical protein
MHAHAPVSDDGEGGMFFPTRREAAVRALPDRCPAVVASAVALVRAPRFVDAFDRALVGLARRSRGLSIVAARASPRPSDPRETPFFPVALAATATGGTICVFQSPRAHPPTLSDEHAR